MDSYFGILYLCRIYYWHHSCDSMLYNERERKLYIFAGQRLRDYLSDFYIYHIDTDCVTEVSALALRYCEIIFALRSP